VKDWRVIDSETVTLPAPLASVYPGSGSSAAIKVHKELSLGCGCMVDFRLGPAVEHDAKDFRVDESYRGMGLLVDLGYVSLRMIRDCREHDVVFAIRLKESWKPRVERVVTADLIGELLGEVDLDTMIEHGELPLFRTGIIEIPMNGSICRIVGALELMPGQAGELDRWWLAHRWLGGEEDGAFTGPWEEVEGVGLASPDPPFRAWIETAWDDELAECIHDAMEFSTPPRAQTRVDVLDGPPPVQVPETAERACELIRGDIQAGTDDPKLLDTFELHRKNERPIRVNIRTTRAGAWILLTVRGRVPARLRVAQGTQGQLVGHLASVVALREGNRGHRHCIRRRGPAALRPAARRAIWVNMFIE
jgi:hypothetical protein